MVTTTYVFSRTTTARFAWGQRFHRSSRRGYGGVASGPPLGDTRPTASTRGRGPSGHGVRTRVVRLGTPHTRSQEPLVRPPGLERYVPQGMPSVPAALRTDCLRHAHPVQRRSRRASASHQPPGTTRSARQRTVYGRRGTRNAKRGAPWAETHVQAAVLRLASGAACDAHDTTPCAAPD